MCNLHIFTALKKKYSKSRNIHHLFLFVLKKFKTIFNINVFSC